ncbi:MAG TPA: ComF family protein [Opitutaceae bacterium]|nr:ComF family protein [Opitutaceae bacterium]
MIRRLSASISAVNDLVFPRSCVSCGGLPEENTFRHLCARCVGQIDFITGPRCSTCGHPFYGEVIGERMCPHCEGLVPAFNRGCTAVLCRGVARALIHELKYRRGVYVMNDIEAIFARCTELIEAVRGATLVPVPLHPRKYRERGYNQSELIAEALTRAAGNSAEIAHLLERSVDTPSQTAFDRRTRLANLKNAFALRSGGAINPDYHYVLVDDVFTTGSTLNSCARVLRRAGCLNLDVVTFGHG